MSERERQRRILVSKAGSAIIDAMIAFIAANGELTAWEWFKAFRAAEDRIMAQELRDQWKETK